MNATTADDSANATALPCAPQWRIVAATCAVCAVTERELRGDSRPRRIAWPRQMAMVLSRRIATTRGKERSLNEIGHYFHRDHTTVLHADQKRKFFLLHEPEWAAKSWAIAILACSGDDQLLDATRAANPPPEAPAENAGQREWRASMRQSVERHGLVWVKPAAPLPTGISVIPRERLMAGRA
jgi:hypothetical protein